MNENELCHFGIQGMKWGVRRYQNPDGTLTPAGVERYKKKLALYESVYHENEKNLYKTNNKFLKTPLDHLWAKDFKETMKECERRNFKYMAQLADSGYDVNIVGKMLTYNSYGKQPMSTVYNFYNVTKSKEKKGKIHQVVFK